LLSESVRELRGLITILGKRLDLVEETIRKTDARLSNKIAYLGESLGETGDDVITIEEKVSGMITDRDHVINVLARIVDSGLKPGHSA
jgi:RNA binding exosome subunit